jgi:hypothetical protein
MKKSSYWEDEVTGGKGTHGTDPRDNLYYQEQEHGAPSPLMARNTPSEAYLGVALSPSKSPSGSGQEANHPEPSWVDSNDSRHDGPYHSAHHAGAQDSGLNLKDSSIITQESVDNAVTGQLLNDRIDQFQWDRFTGKLKALLPASSPVKTRGFGEKHQHFETQIMRSLPASDTERRELSERSVHFMKSLEKRDRVTAASVRAGGITTAVGGGQCVLRGRGLSGEPGRRNSGLGGGGIHAVAIRSIARK